MANLNEISSDSNEQNSVEFLENFLCSLIESASTGKVSISLLSEGERRDFEQSAQNRKYKAFFFQKSDDSMDVVCVPASQSLLYEELYKFKNPIYAGSVSATMVPVKQISEEELVILNAEANLFGYEAIIEDWINVDRTQFTNVTLHAQK